MFSFGGRSQAVHPPQQSLPQQSQQATPIERLTRVSDLPQDAQTLLEQLQAHITSQISLAEQFKLNAEGLEETVESVDTDVVELQRRLARLRSALQVDQEQVTKLASDVEREAANASLSTTFVDGARSRQYHHHHGSSRSSHDAILAYFNDTTAQLELRIEQYARLIKELERHVELLDGSIRSKTLVQALQKEQEAFMSLSNRVAGLHDVILQMQR